jgi:hypothetical protein
MRLSVLYGRAINVMLLTGIEISAVGHCRKSFVLIGRYLYSKRLAEYSQESVHSLTTTKRPLPK